MPPFDNREGAPGGQHGDQQGPHRPAHQQPRRAGDPGAAAGDARLRHRHKGYAYDPEGAKKLLAEAGRRDGFSTELYAMNVDPNPRIAQAIQQDLAAVGIKAEIRSLAQANVIAAGGAGKAPMIWSGGMAWIADFPDPSNFYYGRSSAAPAPSKAAGTGRGTATRISTSRAEKADAMVEPDQGRGARSTRGSGIFDDDHGGRALGAGLQRAALHLCTRRGSAATDHALHRSDPHPGRTTTTSTRRMRE